MRVVLGLALFALPLVARACYNDRDTLGFELKNRPNVQKALTGRFDRFPPLYYQMRIDRLRAKGSLSAIEYDDLAVAYGRLGKNRDALRALAEKERLPQLTSDDRYRLFANRGTVRAHQWIQDGAKAADLPLLKAAERDIATAIKINPKAHFGREGAQLLTIQWLISLRDSPKNTGHLGAWISKQFTDGDPVEGLAGLIMLGGAWESPDVALAIAYLVRERSGEELPSFGIERYKELIAQGRKAIAPELADKMLTDIAYEPAVNNMEVPEPSITRYKRLRKEADTWLASKTEYMMGRLKLGQHPDTTPGFWSEWHETPMPTLPIKNKEMQEINRRTNELVRFVTVGACGLLLLMFVLWLRAVIKK